MDNKKVEQALKEIFDRSGTEVVQNRKVFMSAVYDLLQEEWKYKDERTILKLAMESNAIPILLSASPITSDSAERAVEQIRKDMHMDSEDAKFVVQCVVAACGYNPDIVTENEKRRQEEEAERIRKEEERIRREEEQRRQEEERKKQEKKKRQEKEKKRKEEQKRQEMERKQREEEQKRQEEERKRREEEQKRQEEERKKQEEEQKRQEEERKRREEEEKRQEEKQKCQKNKKTADIDTQKSDNVNESKMKQIMSTVSLAMAFWFLTYTILRIIDERYSRYMFCAAAVIAVPAACWMQKVCSSASKQKYLAYIKGVIPAVIWGIAAFVGWFIIVDIINGYFYNEDYYKALVGFNATYGDDAWKKVLERWSEHGNGSFYYNKKHYGLSSGQEQMILWIIMFIISFLLGWLQKKVLVLIRKHKKS